MNVRAEAPEGSRATQGRLLWPILVLAFYSILAVALTWPLVTRMATAVPNDIGDPLLNTWILAWDHHALLTQPLRLFDANIFHPLPRTLAYSEHLISSAGLMLPLQGLIGEPVVIYNLSLLISFPLAAFGMYLLVLHWTHSRSAAFIAGLIFGFAPYRFAAVAHLQLLTFQWLPLAVLFLDKFMGAVVSLLRHRWLVGAEDVTVQPPRPPRGGRKTVNAPLWGVRGAKTLSNFEPTPLATYTTAFSIFLALQLLASWYLAVYTLFIMAIFMIVWLITVLWPRSATTPADEQSSVRPKGDFSVRRWLTLGLPLVMTVGLTILFAAPYVGLVDALREARPLSQSVALAASATDYVAAAPFNTFFGPLTAAFRDRSFFTEENTLFIGIVAPGLALVGLAVGLGVLGDKKETERRLRLRLRLRPMSEDGDGAVRASFLRVWLSLGLILFISLTLTFAGPYTLLATLVPGSSIVRVPPRWIIPALFGLAGLAGLGYATIENLWGQTSRQAKNLQSPDGQRGLMDRWRANPIAMMLPVGIAVLLVLETVSIPLPLAAVENHQTLNPIYAWLRAQPDDFALLELPLHSAPAPEFPEVKRLYASTLGWWPLINGYSGYTPPRQPELAQALANFPDDRAVAALQALAGQIAVTNGGKMGELLPETFDSAFATPTDTFSQNDVGQKLYMVIHPGEAPFDRTQWETIDRWRVERNPVFRPLGYFAGEALYQVLPPVADRFTGPPLARFGPEGEIELRAAELITIVNLPGATNVPRPDDTPNALALVWQSTVPLPADYTVFIHFRAADGFVRQQVDGPPVGGTYPTGAWLPLVAVQDIHPFAAEAAQQADHIAVGLYNPVTGARLPAFDDQGRRQQDDAIIIALH
ncbi:MAG: hypothetical protein KDJ65_24390 [Anaerolineae bacterium]|nr:hypothetical protein [Anaerolineae bacterium]